MQKHVGAGREAVDADQDSAGVGVMRIEERSVEVCSSEPFESSEVTRTSAEHCSADTGRVGATLTARARDGVHVG